ncbi:class IV adenylate cyclase [Stieleria sp. JC731]|uniref:class IV adenylate cyclase n=1 Tax=Pirellulaceae TaxID=2691357 RepID=UPI001E458281|nr:class IV adenylate cyclase [Stieleria sp. JC731]MCC9601868.1 class IV adenylate cyclase [Stieleria sp. JC731]
MLEIESKYRIDDPSAVCEHLISLGAQRQPIETHADTYLRHPCRDFAQTKEALRVRLVDGVASVTYKGPKLNLADSDLKARKEIEWCLAPADAEGEQMTSLMNALGFEPVATVRKQRQTFKWSPDDERADFSVTVDRVEKVGTYAEIELLLHDESPEAVAAAGDRIRSLAAELGLHETERRSYLSLLLSLS